MKPELLISGLTFPEGPRWHAGRLYFSDFFTHRVLAVDEAGQVETIATVPGQPSGLGWRPDGRLLVVSMTDRRLLRLDPGGLVEVADLSAHAPFHCNDMVVDRHGRAYVGNFGFNPYAGESPRATCVVRVDPDGAMAVAAAELEFPNGTVITPDGGTLIVAESYGRRLTAFDLAADGTLSGRRTFAELAPSVPDGICLDAEGAVWSADPRHREAIRVAPGGRVLERVSTGERGCYACMLGGSDRRTLFLCTSGASGEEAALMRSGCIESVRVAVPGAGLP